MAAARHSELRIPADPTFIVVAKRAAAAFASVAGLHVEGIDDVVIAVAQACEHAIGRLHHAVGEGVGELRIEFTIEGRRLDVTVRSMCTRAEADGARRRHDELLAQRRAAEAQRRLLAEQQHQDAVRAGELALQLMGLFVDDFGYRLDDRTGATRVRLTKYRVS